MPAAGCVYAHADAWQQPRSIEAVARRYGVCVCSKRIGKTPATNAATRASWPVALESGRDDAALDLEPSQKATGFLQLSTGKSELRKWSWKRPEPGIASASAGGLGFASLGLELVISSLVHTIHGRSRLPVLFGRAGWLLVPLGSPRDGDSGAFPCHHHASPVIVKKREI
jgi:hypothetical protein